MDELDLNQMNLRIEKMKLEILEILRDSSEQQAVLNNLRIQVFQLEFNSTILKLAVALLINFLVFISMRVVEITALKILSFWLGLIVIFLIVVSDQMSKWKKGLLVVVQIAVFALIIWI